MALAGRVVTMDDHGTVLENTVLYAQDGLIVDLRPVGAPPPPGFEAVPVVQTKGTIFPGLVELHNHLPYDVLSLWRVPKKYGNRDQWSGPGNPDYRRLITGPMQVLGAQPEVASAVVRFAETRCLLGGTTTSQGITLAKSPSIVTHFRGLVRNVEDTGDPLLPAALTHIADVVAADGEKFLERVSGDKKLILHLAEGADASAARHFAALQVRKGTWAVTDNLIGIHCVALTDSDFEIYGAHGGSMVWSPLSNLLLYGRTADVGAALKHHVPVALGSDWAPSGSKNLLGELKVARLAAQSQQLPLSSADLVAMVTRTPAAMLGWGDQVGSLRAGLRADLLVVAGTTADPCDALVGATEGDIALVAIAGVPRVGSSTLMQALGVAAAAGSEAITVAGRKRVLNLVEPTADPTVSSLSVAEATSVLSTALAGLPSAHAAAALPDAQLRLAVEGLVDNHMSSRPHLRYRGKVTGPNYHDPGAPPALAAVPPVLPALTLDPLTAVDNPGYYDLLAVEPNLPDDVRAGLLALRPA
jgi:cytosine/adenosine deaminase-related metal-dependent hydrolase